MEVKTKSLNFPKIRIERFFLIQRLESEGEVIEQVMEHYYRGYQLLERNLWMVIAKERISQLRYPEICKWTRSCTEFSYEIRKKYTHSFSGSKYTRGNIRFNNCTRINYKVRREKEKKNFSALFRSKAVIFR